MSVCSPAYVALQKPNMGKQTIHCTSPNLNPLTHLCPCLHASITLQKPNATLKELQAFLSEATLWATLRHANILAFHGACLYPVPGKPICLVSEHMPGGDLFSALRASPERFRCVGKSRGREWWRGRRRARHLVSQKSPP